MPKIDVTRFMEQSGMRKARFGGYEPDDVRAALQALCTEYEQRLGRAEAQARKAEQENAALQQHCQTLTAQNNRLSGQQLYILTPERKPGRPGFRPTGAQPFAERPGGRPAAEER